MNILALAKEMGIPYERLLDWCREAGMPYRFPDEEVTPRDEGRARAAFARRRGAPPEDGEGEDGFPAGWPGEEELDLEGIPRTLEELEALERDLLPAPPPRRRPPEEKRIPPREVLLALGVEGKAAAKRVRRLLPEHLARLLQRETLGGEQARRLREGMEERLPLCCGDPVCVAILADRFGRDRLVPTRRAAACRVCRGSPTKRSLQRAAFACARAGIRRILVIGGSPGTHAELRRHAPEGLEFRLVTGDVTREKPRAAADLRWCDVAVVWTGTILDHKVSRNYTRARGKDREAPILVVKRRSIEALCEEVARYAQDRIER